MYVFVSSPVKSKQWSANGIIRNKHKQKLTQFYADLADRPGGVVAHGDVLRVQILAQDGQKVSDERVHMLEACLRQVPEQGKRRLSYLRHRILHALVQQLHNVAADDE